MTMGLGGISVTQLLIIFAIALVLFGTKRLRTLGGDLGAAISSFRRSMRQNDDDEPPQDSKALAQSSNAAASERDA
jgi:sec-independent protein translocase protein TatA